MVEVIPVIDLKDGLVVHARAGERARYRPLEGSRVCASAEPIAVVNGLLGAFSFAKLYVADLDAITKCRGHEAVLQEIEARHPSLEIWVDAGLNDERACRDWLSRHRGRLVLGSETQGDCRLVEALSDEPQLALSLDHRGDERLGPTDLFEAPRLWPERVIVMTLAQVGSSKGPDLPRLHHYRDLGRGFGRALARPRQIVAAGGVRDAADLAELDAAGIGAVLVASALHNGRLTPADLKPAVS